jgi:hypothetical protein
VSSSCGAASCWAYAAPPNSVRVTAVTKLTSNFFAFIILLSMPSHRCEDPSAFATRVEVVLGAVNSAATVRQRPQTGVKPGSSFVQDGLFLVLVVAAIW